MRLLLRNFELLDQVIQHVVVGLMEKDQVDIFHRQFELGEEAN